MHQHNHSTPPKNSNSFGRHDHIFGQDRKRPGEGRTTLVILLTSAMMLIEVIAGLLFGSMALLADGLHMASHTTALSINLYAYIYARHNAHNKRYSFGTGKVNALGGFTGALLLAVFALLMVWGSIERIVHPVQIAFNQAIMVAFIGLIVNGISVFILGHDSEHHRGDHPDDHHHDHNLKSAYLHVLADALTSILAIAALLIAKNYGLIWMDPVMGILGAILVFRWSLGLLGSTSVMLLDQQGPDSAQSRIRESIEKSGANRVVDLHLWGIGPNIYSVIISLVTCHPKPPQHYKDLLPGDLHLEHITIEVNPDSSDPKQLT